MNRLSRKSLWITSILAVIGLLAFGVAFAQEDEVAPPFMGITYAPDGLSGLVVTEVLENTPAAEAELQVGDVIVVVDSELVTAENIADILGEHSVGDTLTLELLREGDDMTVDLTLVARPDNLEMASAGIPENLRDLEIERPRARLGIAVDSAEADAGAVVMNVVEGSPAAEANIQTDDIITAVNGEVVTNATELVEAIAELEPGDTVTLDIQRGDETTTADIELGTSLPSFNLDIPMHMGELIPGEITFDNETDTWSVDTLTEESPLYDAGLREGDVITAINGETVTSPMSLFEVMSSVITSDNATLTVERDSETIEVDADVSVIITLMATFVE